MSRILIACVVLICVASVDADDVPAEPTKPTAAAKPVAKPQASAKPKKEQPWTPGGKYRAHDMNRPRPPIVTPPTASTADKAGTPPSDAIVLFDGKQLDAWLLEGRDPKTKQPLTRPANWKVENGYAEIPPRIGGSRSTIVTRREFGACQLHLEWMSPVDAKGTGQGRGNSGVLLHGICEVQLLDSYDNDTYPDGQAAAIYSNYPPLVNASRKPGEWQMLDVIFEPAEEFQLPQNSNRPLDKLYKQVGERPLRPARITVLHNGLIVQHAEELESTAKKFKLALQDHTNPLRFRNIWIRELKERP